MEIYRDSSGTVTFEHPYTGITSVAVYDDAALVATPTVAPLATLTPTFASGVWSVVLPWTVTQFDRTLRLRWTDNATPQFMRETQVDVVTPIVSTRDIGALPSYIASGAAPGDLAEVESKVRGAIKAYTGQKFGYYEGSENIFGHGYSYLKMPQRLVELTSVTGTGITPAVPFTLSGDGWYVTVPDYTFMETKEAPPEEWQTFNDYRTDGVVRVPSTYSTFGGHILYTVTGKWGYRSVPSSVREAALLLADDYANLDVTYRDRYVENISATDWVVGYNEMSFRGTGNARADALLEPYRANTMEII